MSHYIVSVKDFRLECFSFLLSCISKIIYPSSVIIVRLNSDVSFAKIPCLSFLECINYFSFELVGMFRLFACRLDSFGTDYTCLFNECEYSLFKQ